MVDGAGFPTSVGGVEGGDPYSFARLLVNLGVALAGIPGANVSCGEVLGGMDWRFGGFPCIHSEDLCCIVLCSIMYRL
jgi:hypothetical protein